ncbi:MAG: hypothetical protein L6V79_02840 [Clostridium sp.]|nr:MAG: hypothetical protein L6V79_02840 [Clostridium sp.]
MNEVVYKNRYDVTVLINGLPLVQIELKRPGVEINEAINQINRYRRYSFRGLFHFIQCFCRFKLYSDKNISQMKNETNADGTYKSHTEKVLPSSGRTRITSVSTNSTSSRTISSRNSI